jgi:tetratricopeptide (TPR) repeat protein
MPCRWSSFWIVVFLASAAFPPCAWSQTVAPVGTGKGAANTPSDIELVEKLLVARREYQKILEQLRAHYLSVGDTERAKWAEEELRQYHRIPKQAFRLELDVPPPTLQANTNIPDANKLYMRAMNYKDHGWGNDYIDNQRRAELLFQQLLTQYPQSNKISDAAYQLGDLYDSKAYRQYRRAASYFERCYQWNPTTHFDARLRAARIYDRQLLERGRAIEIYREILNTETDPRHHEEAQKRLSDLSAAR